MLKGYQDGWKIITSPFPTPTWPWGVVTLTGQDGERGTTVRLPPLLLWGRSAPRDAEREIRNALQIW